MEEAATDRQARLKALRESAQATANDAAPAAADKADVPVVKFRNYKPRDEAVLHERVRLQPE